MADGRESGKVHKILRSSLISFSYSFLIHTIVTLRHNCLNQSDNTDCNYFALNLDKL